MWAVIYADSGQVVALRRTEAEARRVAAKRRAGGELDVKRRASHGTESFGGNGTGKTRQARPGLDRRGLARHGGAVHDAKWAGMAGQGRQGVDRR